MSDRELMQQALEALEYYRSAEDYQPTPASEAIAALRERLAQPEQEPVAYIDVEKRCLEWARPTFFKTPTVVELDKVPLYTVPPRREWVGLTEEERDSFWRADQMTGEEWRELFDAIEAKLKEKNA